MRLHKWLLLGVCAAGLTASVAAVADGLVVDKIYHPYVDALETEIELRSVFQDEQPNLTNKAQVHQFAIGKALSDKVFAEVYMIGGKDRARGFENEAWEAEIKWQLSDQGEYSADWGVVVEYEDENTRDIQEFAVGIIAEKEFSRWSGTANFFMIREWGDDIRSEYETTLGLQARYRYSPLLEPTVEFYAGQDTRAIGPVLQGTMPLGIRKNLHWEAGVIFGLDSVSANKTWRMLLEYEF